MKKILLININSDDRRKNSFPLGLAYLSSALKDYDTEIFDLNFHDDKELFLKIARNHYDVVGISCYTGVFSRATQIAKSIKEIDVRCVTVVGGYHATAEHRYIIDNHPEFDVAIIGRGEIPFVELMKNIDNLDRLSEVPQIAYKKGGTIYVNDCLHFPSSSGFIPNRNTEDLYFDKDDEEKVACIATMRGCYHKCSFCSISINDPVQIYNRNLVEMDVLNAVRNKANSLYFINPDFLSNRICIDNTLDVLDKFPEIKTFKISTRADSILRNLEILDRLFKRGCNSIEVGIESFSDDQLKRYNKGVTSKVNVESYKVITELSKKYSFRYIHEIIPFDPWVSKSELKKTVDFYLNNDFDYIEIEPWLFTKLMLYPMTDLRARAEQEGIINHDNRLEIPEWKFINSDVSEIYSALIRYKILILPRIFSLRKEIDCLLEDRKNILLVKKSLLFALKDILSKATVIFFSKLLQNEPEQYNFLIIEEEKKINDITKKIRRIKNEY